jgi:hypothetical protein
MTFAPPGPPPVSRPRTARGPRGGRAASRGFLSVGTTAAATRVTRAFFEDLERLGDTPYLADLKPWLDVWGSKITSHPVSLRIW